MSADIPPIQPIPFWERLKAALRDLQEAPGRQFVSGVQAVQNAPVEEPKPVPPLAVKDFTENEILKRVGLALGDVINQPDESPFPNEMGKALSMPVTAVNAAIAPTGKTFGEHVREPLPDIAPAETFLKGAGYPRAGAAVQGAADIGRGFTEDPFMFLPFVAGPEIGASMVLPGMIPKSGEGIVDVVKQARKEGITPDVVRKGVSELGNVAMIAGMGGAALGHGRAAGRTPVPEEAPARPPVLEKSLQQSLRDIEDILKQDMPEVPEPSRVAAEEASPTSLARVPPVEGEVLSPLRTEPWDSSSSVHITQGGTGALTLEGSLNHGGDTVTGKIRRGARTLRAEDKLDLVSQVENLSPEKADALRDAFYKTGYEDDAIAQVLGWDQNSIDSTLRSKMQARGIDVAEYDFTNELADDLGPSHFVANPEVFVPKKLTKANTSEGLPAEKPAGRIAEETLGEKLRREQGLPPVEKPYEPGPAEANDVQRGSFEQDRSVDEQSLPIVGKPTNYPITVPAGGNPIGVSKAKTVTASLNLEKSPEWQSFAQWVNKAVDVARSRVREAVFPGGEQGNFPATRASDFGLTASVLDKAKLGGGEIDTNTFGKMSVPSGQMSISPLTYIQSIKNDLIDYPQYKEMMQTGGPNFLPDDLAMRVLATTVHEVTHASGLLHPSKDVLGSAVFDYNRGKTRPEAGRSILGNEIPGVTGRPTAEIAPMDVEFDTAVHNALTLLRVRITTH